MSFIKYVKLREVSEEDLEKINPNRDLRFNNIFGNKLRIVIPLEQDNNVNKLTSKLEELGYEVDYEDLANKKQAYKKIKTQQGEKRRPEKIGKILQSNNEKELLDWWQKNGENLKNNEVGSSIIISRSPIDIVRMSDHDGISSCHSPDGQFYKCAKQEARTGGAIAYVVKNSDLKGINIQEKEIFEDPDRDVDGIIPLERLRLRRLTNGEFDLLLPELRTYGIKNVGFLDAIKNWAKNSQENLIKKIDPTKGYKSFKLKGGSYQDTDSGRVWSNFFDVSVSGSKRSEDEDEENEDESGDLDLYERAERTLEDHRRNWKHVDVYLEENDGYLYYSASAGFFISAKLFTVNIGDWKSVEYKNIKRIVEDALDINGLENLEINHYKDSYNIIFSIEHHDNGYVYDQITNFEHFLDYIDEVDKAFEDNINKVYKALLDEGYIKDLSGRVEFKNFDLELNDEDFTIKSKKPEKIGYIREYTIPSDYIATSWNHDNEIRIRDWNKLFKDHINTYNVLPFKVSQHNHAAMSMVPVHAKINLFLDRTTSQGWSSSLIASDPDPSSPKNLRKITGWVYFTLDISLNLDLYKNSEVIKKIKNLDNNWDFYIKKLAKLFDLFIKNQQDLTAPSLADAADEKILAQKPIFRKSNQLRLGFKEWLESLAYEKIFAQRDETQQSNVGKLLGFAKNLKLIKQGSFASLYQHPKYKNKLIKITSHKEDIYNLIRSQNLKSKNIVNVFNWDDKQKIKEIPHLNSLAIIVENVIGSPMIYTTNDFYELSLYGKFNLASEWIIQGGHEKQKFIMEKYSKNNNLEHDKLFDLFRTLYQLRKFYKIDLSDFEDNILDSGSRYVIVDMGF